MLRIVPTGDMLRSSAQAVAVHIDVSIDKHTFAVSLSIASGGRGRGRKLPSSQPLSFDRGSMPASDPGMRDAA